MNKILLSVGVVGLIGVVYYVTRKPQYSVSATGMRPINTLPARAYALNGNFNPQGQPPPATFAPFSGVPFVENLLSGFGSANQGSTPDVNPRTTDAFSGANFDGSTSYDSGSGGSGGGGSGFDVGYG